MPAAKISCTYVILKTLRFPTSGRRGEHICVVAGAENLWVLDRTGDHVLQRSFFEEGKLWSELQRLEEKGYIKLLFGVAAVRFSHLPQADAAPSPRAFRVLSAS